MALLHEHYLAARRVERLTRDVAAPVPADLPAPPRHRPAVLVVCQLFHVPLGYADVIDILHPGEMLLFLQVG